MTQETSFDPEEAHWTNRNEMARLANPLPAASETIEQAEDRIALEQALVEAKASLTERQHDYLDEYYRRRHDGEDPSTQQMAEALGVSVSRIRQLHNSTMAELAIHPSMEPFGQEPIDPTPFLTGDYSSLPRRIRQHNHSLQQKNPQIFEGKEHYLPREG